MTNYLFRFPADTPTLTYDGLRNYMAGLAAAKIGTTVEVIDFTGSKLGDMVTVLLYGIPIARIYPQNHVAFAEHGDRHQATREWTAKIIADNEIGQTAWRPRRGYVKGIGSPLCIDGDPEKPVEGNRYIGKGGRVVACAIKASTIPGLMRAS